MRRLLPAMLVWWWSMAALLAQVSTTHVDAEGNDICTVRAFVSGGMRGGCGLGFACVDVRNLDDRTHNVLVEFVGARRRGGDVRSARELTIEGNDGARFWLPIAMPPWQGRLRVTVEREVLETTVGFPRSRGIVGLYVTDRPDSKSAGLDVLQRLQPDLPGGEEIVTCLSQDIPADWRLFTSFPAVILDGRANVDDERQEALRRYAFSGGRVLCLASERLPAGPLRELLARQARGVEPYGLGTLAVLPAVGRDNGELYERMAKVPAVGGRNWPMNEKLFATQDIAGLGRAPVGVFITVIVLFAILVGPVNFMFLRRRKRPLLALLTVPLAGFGTTAAILLYGIFHDGFGVRGTVTSWTVLDQVRHEAVTVSARTLFAGLAPDELTMEADAMVLSLRAGERGDHSDRWHWDVDQQRLDGGVLPSRTVTPLVSVQQGTMRERLTLRPSADGSLRVVTGGGVQPLGPMVLCDLDGQFWTGRQGKLERVSKSDGQAAFVTFAQSASQMPVPGEDLDTVYAMGLPTMAPLRALVKPGTYALQAQQAGWLDDHGVTVNYDYECHYVFGRLAAEDFVR